MTKMDKNPEFHPASLLAKVRLVALVLLLGALALVPIAFYLNSLPGVIAVLAAFGSCLVAGVLALVLASPFKTADQILYQVLVTTGVRMMIPLAVVLLIYFQRGPLANAGLVYYLLIFYGLTLATETFLATNSRTHQQANATN